MRPDCETVREDIDAYAIGALDADEARALEGHIAHCGDCTQRVEEAAEAGTALALAVPLVSSGPSLKARVLASAAVLGEVSATKRRAYLWQTAAAALVLLGMAGLAWGAVVQRRVDRLGDRNAAIRVDATAQSDQLATVRTQLVQMTDFNRKLADTVGVQDVVLDIVSQPDVRRTQMMGSAFAPTATGRYLWSPNDDMGALVAMDLPPLADGKQYQMWLVYRDRWAPGGSFAVDAKGSGQLIVRKADAAASDEGPPLWFCVTVEPVGSAQRPSGPMVLRSS